MDNVKRDIKNYWSKVKAGGIFGGHDFYNSRGIVNQGVVKAVIEFVIVNNLDLYVDDGEWWVYKKRNKT